MSMGFGILLLRSCLKPSTGDIPRRISSSGTQSASFDSGPAKDISTNRPKVYGHWTPSVWSSYILLYASYASASGTTF